jgi:hypothetical protein
MSVGDKGAQGLPEVDNIACRLFRCSRASNYEIVESDDSLIVHMDVIQAERRSGLAQGFVLEVDVGNAAEQMGEADGFEGLSVFAPVFQSGSGQ